MSILRILKDTGGRLLGRLDRPVPFLLTDPAKPGWSAPVEASIAEELHDGGWIEIDELETIGDIFTFEISAAGKAYFH